MTMRLAQSTATAALCALLSVTAPAAADTITITGGYLDWTRTTSTGTVLLTGSEGFTLRSAVSPSGGFFAPWNQCFGTFECAPGTTVDLTASWGGNDLISEVTLRGTTYSNVGGLGDNDAQAGIHFAGTVVAPPLSGGLVLATAPFAFNGFFAVPNGSSMDRFDLAGSGMASLWLEPVDVASGGGYRLARIRYDLGQSAPVPEPATLLLLGSGVAGAVLRRRRA